MAINKVVFDALRDVNNESISGSTVYKINGESIHINKVVLGANTLIDITDTTATAGKIASGYTAYGANGVKVVGTLEQEVNELEVSNVTVEGTAAIFDEGGSGPGVITITDTTDAAGGTIREITTSGIELTTLNATENQTYTATSGTAYNVVNVNVSGGSSSRLPDGYTEIESIVLNGAQYVKADVSLANGDVIRAKIKPTDLSSLSSGAWSTLFSAGTGTYQFILLLNNSNSYYKYFATGNAVSLSPRLYQDIVYEICATSKLFAVGNDVVHSASSNYAALIDGSDTNLYIGQRANGVSQFYGNIYSFSLSNNGTYKLNLVPCVRNSDSKAGFYDLVSETFMPSMGSDFIAGSSL